VSSSRRPAKRPSSAKTVAKRATARRAAAKGATAKRTPAKGRTARRPAAAKSQPARAAKPPPAKPPPARLALPPPDKPPLPPPAQRPSSQPGRAFRLAGSASSRLTIKPGASVGPRPQLELSTKPRPGGPRRLSEVELDEDEVLIDAFDAMLEGVKVRITAVLERTCVYLDGSGDRRLARKIDLWVEANKLPIRRRGLG
jgi:hypothetical protein